mmetsp:Transcript_35366/g.64737  ORF Transcript_35366/g.64737 Transcript_35366/m.64737 type:complete len:330 (+) Transcript_35366:678-1667(+)
MKADRRTQSCKAVWLSPNRRIDTAACESRAHVSVSSLAISFKVQKTSCHCRHLRTALRFCLVSGSSMDRKLRHFASRRLECSIRFRETRANIRLRRWSADVVAAWLMVKMFTASGADSPKGATRCSSLGSDGNHQLVARIESTGDCARRALMSNALSSGSSATFLSCTGKTGLFGSRPMLRSPWVVSVVCVDTWLGVASESSASCSSVCTEELESTESESESESTSFLGDACAIGRAAGGAVATWDTTDAGPTLSETTTISSKSKVPFTEPSGPSKSCTHCAPSPPMNSAGQTSRLPNGSLKVPMISGALSKPPASFASAPPRIAVNPL